MATETVLMISVGAVLQGSVMAVFGGAQKSVASLGNEIASLEKKHTELGKTIQKHMGNLSAQTIAPMVRDYERMGAAIDKATSRQLKLNNAITAQKQASEHRQQLRGDFREAAGTAAALLAPVGLSVRAYMEQEKAMTDMKVAYMRAGGQVGEAFEEVKRQAVELGNQFPGTTADFLQLGRVLKEQGVRDSAVTGGGLRAAASFNVLMNTPQEVGGEIVAKLMEARGISDSDLVKAVDQMQRAKFAFGMKPEDLKAAMAYDAPTANILGLKGLKNQEQLLALQGMGAQVGLENSSWGTNFAMMLTRMAKGPEAIDNATKGSKAESKDIIAKAGVSFDFFDKSGKFGGVENMVSQLEKIKVIKDKFGEKSALTVANDMFGIEAGRAAMIIAEKGTQGLKDNIQKMREQASLQERMAEKANTLSNAYESFTGTITNGLASVGEVYAQDLREFFTDANKFISDTLVPWVSGHKELISTVTKLVGGLLLGKMAMIGLGYAVNLAGAPFRALNTAYRTFGAVASTFELIKLGPLSKGAGLLRLFGMNAERATVWSDRLSRAGTWTKNKGKAGLEKIGQGVRNAPAAIGGGVKRAAVGTFNLGKSVALGGWNALGATVKAVLHPINTLKAGIRGVGLVGRMVGVALRTSFRFALGAILSISWPVVAVIGVIAGAALLIYKYWKPIRAFFGGVWQGIKEGLQPLAPLFHAIGAVAGKMFAPLRPVWNWLKGALSGIVGWFGKVFKQEEDVGGGARSMGVKVGHAIASFINGAVRLATTVITKFGQVVDWFKALPARFVQFGKDMINGLINGIGSMTNSVLGKIASLGEGIKNKFKSVLGIASPSKVFKGFGGWVMEGLGIGLDAQSGGIIGRIARLGTGMRKAFAPRLDTPTVAMRDAIEHVKEGFGGAIHGGTGAITGAHKGVTVTFSPTINVNGNGQGSTGVREQVEQGLSMGLRELESMMKRIADEQLRKAF